MVIPPLPINYFLVAGQPQDLEIPEQGYWTRREGSYDERYSYGAIQFHPFRYYRPPIKRQLDTPTHYEVEPERWFHGYLKVFPYDSRERDLYPILEFGECTLEIGYKNKKTSELFLRDKAGPQKMAEVDSNTFLEIDLATGEHGTQLYLNEELVHTSLIEHSIPEEILFRASRRDMIWWSQIIVADRDTRTSKLSTQMMSGDLGDEEDRRWLGGYAEINSGEISDIGGLTMLDNGTIRFSTTPRFVEERNFVDSLALSARINTLKEERGISAHLSKGEEGWTDIQRLKSMRYLENSQITIRLNPLEGRRWWYSDLSTIEVGLTSRPPEDQEDETEVE